MAKKKNGFHFGTSSDEMKRKMQSDRHRHEYMMQGARHRHKEYKMLLDDRRKQYELDAKTGKLNSQGRIDALIASGVLTYKDGKLTSGPNAGIPHERDRMSDDKYVPIKKKERTDTYRDFEESLKKKCKKKRKLFW